VERKEFERVNSASSQPGLNSLVRKSIYAIERCIAFPQPLDGIQLEFVGRTCQKSSDIKKLLIPDCIKNSGQVYEEKGDTDLQRCDHWHESTYMSIQTQEHKRPGAYTRSIDSRSTVGMNRAAICPPIPVVCPVACPYSTRLNFPTEWKE
jgi:hypothetical protein